MAQEILDLDKLIPDKRIVKLAGKEIDVSKIPSEVTIEMAAKQDEMKSGTNKSFDMVFETAIKICNASNQDEPITKEWLIKNTTLDQLLALMEFIMKPFKERAEKAQGKNAESPSQ
ncbi:hypothetical protein KM915_25820 [Cytobacillus oceanisediminis]|uniref:hypothetical protein n=1 Tax=Cytobacillus oceanisediminis TaxID=665099 RepID=UPI001C22B0CB|nr:hypothetical protein [Cytobacillus oceanisediminis]MBU8733434.1 hypothetical protein [Cytobacillus oceanisediminis]MCM3242687.1 hypothetical protein [Cytobacillus oceanisediminis]